VKRSYLSSIAVYGGVAHHSPKTPGSRASYDRRPSRRGWAPTNRPMAAEDSRYRLFEVTVKRSWSASHSITPLPGRWRVGDRARQPEADRHLLDVAVLRIPTQFGPGYREMGSPMAVRFTQCGQGNLMAGAGYMACRWRNCGGDRPFPADLRSRHGNCAHGHDSSGRPSASIYNLFQRATHQRTRTAADLTGYGGCRATSELGSGKRFG